MAILRVRRGNTAPTTSNLSYIGELAFDYGSNALYARSSSSVVKVGGEMEVVYYYEGYGYTHVLQYNFDPNYIYKVHVISSTYGSSSDISDTMIYYRDSVSVNLLGSYITHFLNTEDTIHTTKSGKSSSTYYIEDSYVSGPIILSGISKVIDFEISPTFNSSLTDTAQWVAYGKSITTLSGQRDGSIKLADFAHSINGDLGTIYINTGLNIGSPDSLAITLYRIKRK